MKWGKEDKRDMDIIKNVEIKKNKKTGNGERLTFVLLIDQSIVD